MIEFQSRLSLRREVDDVVHDLTVDAKSFGADLAIMFASHHYGPEFVDLARGVYDRINTRNLIGCTGESIIGPTAEIEGRPAVALWLAKLPDVRIFPFVLDQEDLVQLAQRDAAAWHERLGVSPEQKPSFVILPEPFSFQLDACLTGMDECFPGSTIVGGVASGANAPGQNRLFMNEQSLRQGMVGVSLSGPIDVSTVVSQGCRPVGKPYVITKAHQNLVEELGGRPALEVLKKVFGEVAPTDRELMRNGLHLGRLVDEHVQNYGPGDFIIRNMMGVYQESALAVADLMRPGQTVQFHVRDARSADDEMQQLLEAEQSRNQPFARGALLFSCNGRGRSFFEKPNHDIKLVNEHIADCATAGFFAGGEIGPVGGKTFIHGFTSSLILFRPRDDQASDNSAGGLDQIA